MLENSPLIAAWLDLPLELRLGLVALLGLVGAAMANHAISTYAYFTARPISPLLRTSRGGPELSLVQRLPLVGWLLRRNESETHGRGFWVRPMLIELMVPPCLVALYLYETQWGGLLPPEAVALKPALIGALAVPMNQMFFAHALLFFLMIAATFIDFDERTIPDIITIPGTLIAIGLASITPAIFPPTVLIGFPVTPTTFDSPWFAADPSWWSHSGWLIAGTIWSGWCFALCDRRLSGVIFRRRGFARMMGHFINGLFHYPRWKGLAAMWAVGLAALGILASIGGVTWYGCLSSLIGLAAGGGSVWAIRIVGSVALKVEAMGFGDVTLMAMIGAFCGWQAALISFAMAPFAAILIVMIQFVLTRDPRAPFGPYLCAGTVIAILCWNSVYSTGFVNYLLSLGSFLFWLGLSLLGLMGVMLWGWRLFKERFIFRDA